MNSNIDSIVGTLHRLTSSMKPRLFKKGRALISKQGISYGVKSKICFKRWSAKSPALGVEVKIVMPFDSHKILNASGLVNSS